MCFFQLPRKTIHLLSCHDLPDPIRYLRQTSSVHKNEIQLWCYSPKTLKDQPEYPCICLKSLSVTWTLALVCPLNGRMDDKSVTQVRYGQSGKWKKSKDGQERAQQLESRLWIDICGYDYICPNQSVSTRKVEVS